MKNIYKGIFYNLLVAWVLSGCILAGMPLDTSNGGDRTNSNQNSTPAPDSNQIPAPGSNQVPAPGSNQNPVPDIDSNQVPAPGSNQNPATKSVRAVAVGDAGTVIWSYDLRTWEKAAPITTNALFSLAHDGNLWLAVGVGGVLLQSSDGKNWEQGRWQLPNSSAPVTADLYAIAHHNGVWMAAGQGNKLLRSTDGITWNYVLLTETGFYYKLANYGTTWIAVGKRALTSTNGGLDWASMLMPSSSLLVDIFSVTRMNATWYLFGRSKFHAYTEDTRVELFRSNDLKGWDVTALSGLEYFNDAIFFDGYWYGVGGYLSYSDDAITWNRIITFGFDGGYLDVDSDGKNMILVGGGGKIQVSEGDPRTASNWTRINPSPTSENLNQVAIVR